MGHMSTANHFLEEKKASEECARQLFAEFTELRLKADNLTRQRIWGGV